MLQVLVVFVAVFVGCDVGAGFGVPHVLHLVGVFFDADLAEIAQGAHDCRHRGLCLENELGEGRIGQSNNNGEVEVDRGESELKANAIEVGIKSPCRLRILAQPYQKVGSFFCYGYSRVSAIGTFSERFQMHI